MLKIVLKASLTLNLNKLEFHTEGSESSIKNNSRTELPKSTHLDEMEDQPYEPEMHKPKNIFSSLVTDHTNKYYLSSTLIIIDK